MKPDLITDHFETHERVVRESLERLRGAAAAAAGALVEALRGGGKILVFGNGGSAAQASHLAGELMGRFARTRAPLPALALASDPAAATCIGNDFGFEALFERQVEALAGPGDVAMGLSTSGRSENVLRGLAAARRRGAVTIALTGAEGLREGAAEHLLAVPSTVTAHIQEVHLLLLHVWCRAIDEAFALESGS